jgi:type IV pilus assembly protein PilM
MAYPSDVVVLDSDALVHARLSRDGKSLRIDQAKSYRLPADTFSPAVVTPELTGEAGMAETLRRLRMETGRWDKLSLLLPDSWFRINIIDLPSLPERTHEAEQIIRWSLKRTIPLDPSAIRVAFEVLAKSPQTRVLAVSAVEETLAHLERVFGAAGFEINLIEPVGLNIWNAVAVREHTTTRDRVFIYVRENDFTTAVFRGAQPLFVRSRNLTGDRTIEQEIRLSANYVRDTFQATSVENCYLAGNDTAGETLQSLAEVLQSEFSAPVHIVALRDVITRVPDGVAGHDAELTACTGVFTA